MTLAEGGCLKTSRGVASPRPSSASVAKPILLDLFCGAGGAAMGYHRAGFEVVGVDIEAQPNYPFEFIQADALEYLEEWSLWFTAIHASPPCQAYTAMSNRHRGAGGLADSRPDLIAPTRRLLEQSGLPYVIENVPGARRHLLDPIVLTGEMFFLAVHRPRLFELNWSMLVMEPPPCQPDPVGVYGKAHDGRLLWKRADGSELRAASSLEEASGAMGIDWMTWDEIREAIPPAYTAFIGHGLLRHLKAQAAA